MLNQTVSTSPFEKIALSCSGGGYRATAFHLGSMAYLNKLTYNQKPLLEYVKMISTVSGGTITGIVYALKKGQGQSFEEIYDFLLRQLKTLDLIKEGVEKLNPNGEWKNPNKRKNLINAFAELYDENFTKGATIGDLNKGRSHLDTVVFNSTEFDNAIDFRFRNKGAGYCGNFNIRIDVKTASEIKLSDAMAASSCFPGGFEPILWPNDFVHQNSTLINVLKEKSVKTVGLMDGGIYDNQGISSILNYRKNDDPPFFDLIIISDVTSPYMIPFQPFKEAKKNIFYNWTLLEVKTKSKKISKIINWILVSMIILMSFLPMVWQYAENVWTGLSVGFCFGLVLLLIIKVVVFNKISSVFLWIKDSLLSHIPEFYKDKLAHLKIEEISIHHAEPLLIDRINSLITLMMNVFLKVVRRLNYKILYDNNNYQYRRISNLIQELTEEDFNNKRKRRQESEKRDSKLIENSVLIGEYLDIIGDKISKITNNAASFGTTLWFTDQDELGNMLEDLIITGQITMCYNLLEYLEIVIYESVSGFDQLNSQTKENIIETYKQCRFDWEMFKSNPSFMIK